MLDQRVNYDTPFLAAEPHGTANHVPPLTDSCGVDALWGCHALIMPRAMAFANA
jgi:hypothetical protein